MELNEQISRLRRQKNITQEELAQALNVTNQAVSKWESSQCCPDIQLLPAIADIFGISIDELMGHISPNKSTEAPKLTFDDPLLEKAVAVAKESGRVSSSALQRRLRIGFGRATGLLAQMVDKGYIVKSADADSSFLYFWKNF